MIKVIKAKAIKPYILELTFSTNEIKYFDFKPYLNATVFQPLKDYEFFKSFEINTDFGLLTWDNGEIDMSPSTMYLKAFV